MTPDCKGNKTGLDTQTPQTTPTRTDPAVMKALQDVESVEFRSFRNGAKIAWIKIANAIPKDPKIKYECKS